MYAQYICPKPKTSVHWAPLYIGHFGQVPQVPNVERSDCKSNTLITLLMHVHWIDYRLPVEYGKSQTSIHIVTFS